MGALTRALVTMIRQIGIADRAPGTETEGELRALRAVGVGFAQADSLRMTSSLAAAFAPLPPRLD